MRTMAAAALDPTIPVLAVPARRVAARTPARCRRRPSASGGCGDGRRRVDGSRPRPAEPAAGGRLR